MADRYIFGASSAPAAGANVRVQLAAADLALMAGFKRGTASIEIDGADGAIFTASSASNFTVTGADLLIDTVTSGDLTLSSAHDLVVGIPNLNDAVDRLMTIYGTNRGAGRADLAIGFSHKIEIDSEDASYFKVTDAALTLATVTTGILTLESGNAEAAANAVDINALYGGVTIDAYTSVSIDALTDSNITVTGSAQSLALAVVGGGVQKLILDSAGTGADSVDITSSVGGIQLNSALGVDIVGAATVSTTLGVTGAVSGGSFAATTGSMSVASNALYGASSGTYGNFQPKNTTQTADGGFWLTGTASNSFVLCEYADRAFDFQFPQQTNPTLAIFSANQSLNEYISFAHDQTDAVINSGLGAVTLANGVLRVAETTTPGARANYGAFYTKNDNIFYVQDGDGVEHALRYADANLGEMWLNNNGNPTVIETAATPIMIRNYTTGDLANWTYHVGTTGGITVYADYSGTVAGTVLVTSAGHGLSTGDIISIRGAANYIGIYSITWVAAGTFYITAAWAGDDGASDWDQGDYLLAGAGAAGKYIEAWTLGLSEGGAAGSTVLVRAYKNATVCLKCTMPRKFANNDVGAMAGHSMMDIVEGDRVALTIESVDGTNDFTVSWGNLSLHQL